MSDTTNTQNDTPAHAEGSPTLHAKHSPSGLKMRMLCPGFDNRENSSSRASDMGTRIHLALETNNPDVCANEFEVGLMLECQEALTNIIDVNEIDTSSTATKIFREVRLNITLPNGISTFGTCDLLILASDKQRAVMVDWKTGVMAVDPPEVNMQAQAYVLGAFQAWPEVNEIAFYFVLPQRKEFGYHLFLRSQTPEIALRLMAIIERKEAFDWIVAHNGTPPIEMLNPQPNLCEFCANTWKCPAIHAKLFDLTKKYDTGLPVPPIVHGSQTDNPQWLAQVLKLKPVLEACVSGVTDKAKTLIAEQGVEIPGFQTSLRQGTKSITSAAAAWNGVQEVVPTMSIEEFLGALENISFTKVADLVGEAAPNRKKSAYKAMLEASLVDNDALIMPPPAVILQQKRL